MKLSKYLIPYNLQFFAKEGVGGEKTEEATPKKLEDAREKGQVAKSVDMVSAFMLLGFFLALKIFAGWVGNSFMSVYYDNYKSIADIVQDGFTINRSAVLLREVLLDILKIAMPVFIIKNTNTAINNETNFNPIFSLNLKRILFFFFLLLIIKPPGLISINLLFIHEKIISCLYSIFI